MGFEPGHGTHVVRLIEGTADEEQLQAMRRKEAGASDGQGTRGGQEPVLLVRAHLLPLPPKELQLLKSMGGPEEQEQEAESGSGAALDAELRQESALEAYKASGQRAFFEGVQAGADGRSVSGPLLLQEGCGLEEAEVRRALGPVDTVRPESLPVPAPPAPVDAGGASGQPVLWQEPLAMDEGGVHVVLRWHLLQQFDSVAQAETELAKPAPP